MIGARNLIRRLTHDFLPCSRQRYHISQQQFADLPSVRVTQPLPFGNGRRMPKFGGHVLAWSVCLHGHIGLKLATDLTAQTFLAALRRFIFPRSKCNISRSLVTMEQTSLELKGPSTKCMNFFHLDNTNTSSHKTCRTTEFNGNLFLGELVIREGNGCRQFVVSTVTFEKMRTFLAQINVVINLRTLC